MDVKLCLRIASLSCLPLLMAPVARAEPTTDSTAVFITDTEPVPKIVDSSSRTELTFVQPVAPPAAPAVPAVPPVDPVTPARPLSSPLSPVQQQPQDSIATADDVERPVPVNQPSRLERLALAAGPEEKPQALTATADDMERPLPVSRPSRRVSQPSRLERLALAAKPEKEPQASTDALQGLRQAVESPQRKILPPADTSVAGRNEASSVSDLSDAAPEQPAEEQDTPRPQPLQLNSSSQLLITAHELSKDAGTIDEYAAIIERCSRALQMGLQDDKQAFAKHLCSWALNRRGQLRLDAGEMLAASADFQAALDFNPENWRAIHNRGVIHAQSVEFAEAFDDFNRVLALNPRYAKAYSNRAMLYVKADDLQAALADYQRAAELDPEFATAHVGQGRVCHMLGRLDEAVQHFTTAVQLDPTNAEMICSRGDLLTDMGRYAEALADYARTIELAPDFGHAYRNGAWLLATCPLADFRDAENAILGAEEALDLGYGERHVALDTLAAALANGGQFEEAMQTISEAIELAPPEAKFAYLSRLQMYQDGQPFRIEPVGDVFQAVYEVSDR